MRQDKRKWVDHLAMEAEEAAQNGRMKEVYDITKTLSNDKRKTTNAVKDKCGNLITEGLARRKQWKEHFEEILNRPIPNDPVTDVEIDPITNEISTDQITKAEIRIALSKMKNGYKMELHVKTRGPGLCRRHSTHVIMLHTHAHKDKTTESICRKDRTKNK